MNTKSIILTTLFAIVLIVPSAFAQRDSSMGDGWAVIEGQKVGEHNHWPGGDFQGKTSVFVWGKATTLPVASTAGAAGTVIAATINNRLSFPVAVGDAEYCTIQILDVSESNWIGAHSLDDTRVKESQPANATVVSISAVTTALSVSGSSQNLVSFSVIGSVAITGASASTQSGGVMNYFSGDVQHIPGLTLPMIPMNFDNLRAPLAGDGSVNSPPAYTAIPVVQATMAGMYRVDTRGIDWLTLHGRNTNRAILGSTYVTVVKKFP